MNVPKAWIEILCLTLCLGQIFANIDSKEYFCGKKLVKTLNELCAIYNNPSFGRNRFRRQIIQECCRSQCSRRHLVQYYCLEANSSVINLLKSKPESSEKPAKVRSKTFQMSSVPAEEKNSLTVGSKRDSNKTLALPQRTLHLDSLSSSFPNKTSRGKRYCKCRKRRAKRVKKTRQMLAPKNFIHRPVPPPNIGKVENSQTPFYVWKFQKAF